MSDVCNSQVIFVKESSITVLVLNGDWKDNVYKMPIIPDVEVFQFKKIKIHSNGTRAEWQFEE